MIFLYILFVFLFILISSKKKKTLGYPLLIFILLSLLLFKFLTYSPKSIKGSLNIIDSSTSLKYSNYHIKNKHFFTIDKKNNLTRFKKFNKLGSPIYDEIKMLGNYSIMNNLMINYYSDFNYTEPFEPKPFYGNISLIPIEGEKRFVNSEIVDVFPKNTYLEPRNTIYLKIASEHKTHATVKIQFDNKPPVKKNIMIEQGENIIPMEFTIRHPGVYSLHVQVQSNDDIEFDDHFYSDIILKKRTPHIIIVYSYPSKDIGILARILRKDGFKVDSIEKEQIKDMEDYDAFIFYNTNFSMSTHKPVLLVGNCKNEHLVPFFKKGITINNRSFNQIQVKSKILKGNFSSMDSNKPLMGHYYNNFFLTITGFYHYMLKNDHIVEHLLLSILTSFEHDILKYPHFSFNSKRFIENREFVGIFSQNIDSISINKSNIIPSNGSFSFNPPKGELEIIVKSNGQKFIRNYKVFPNDLEKKYCGFDKNKYSLLRSLLKNSSSNNLKTDKSKINLFEHPFFLILILVLLILFWVF
ncbi:hypothetical protein J7L48_07440 [bacterium]|nr:hypothetical protein [bacterium]